MNYVTTQYTTSEPFFKKGDEFFQVDLSGLITGSVFKQLTDPNPDERNYGFWNDTNMGLNDFIEQMHAEYISKEEFEAVWNEELVRVDKKSYR